MDTTKIRTGLLQLQHDASANTFDFAAAYQSIQEWVSSIRREASFQPLLMAQIQNTTTDGRLSGMALLLRQQLQQSAGIDVMGEARTAEILARM